MIVLLLMFVGCEQPDQEVISDTVGELVVHFIDAGQADATLIQTNEHIILFDAGDWNKTDVIDYLNTLPIDKIDLVIGSHPDADHIGQLPLVLNQYSVDEVWLSGVNSTSGTYERTLDAILEKQLNYHEPRAGESYQLGELEIEVLSPQALSGDANEDSIAIKVIYGETGMILTGDAGLKAEEQMIAFSDNLAVDILHLGHHGSQTSTGEAFLTATKPSYAIISASKNNSYGHPHPDVLTRLQDHNIDIYATYEQGTILFYSDGHTFLSNSNANDLLSSIEDQSCINLNEAKKEELTEIIHIGIQRAEQIILLRPLGSIEALLNIDGIGQGRLDEIIIENKACVR